MVWSGSLFSDDPSWRTLVHGLFVGLALTCIARNPAAAIVAGVITVGLLLPALNATPPNMDADVLTLGLACTVILGAGVLVPPFRQPRD